MGVRRGWSLRARFTALLVATLLPLMGLGVYWALWEARHERTHQEREAREIAARLAAQAGHRVGAVQEMLAILVRLRAVQAQELGPVERIFRETLAGSPHLENVALFTPEGVLAASAVPAARGARVSVGDRAWFQAAVASGKTVDGGFQIGRITSKPVVVLAAPALGREGQVLAVVSASLRLAAVNQEVAPPQRETAAQWAVVDGRGLVLLSGDSSLTLGHPLGPLPGVLQTEAVVPGTAWQAVVWMPQAAIAARTGAALVRIGLPAILILFAAAAAALSIAYQTWRPLQELEAAARALGTGEMDRRVHEGGPGEVADLARAFNAMADRRQQAESALQTSIVRREALARLSADIAAGTDRAEIMREVVEATARLLNARYAALWTLNPGEALLVADAEFVDPALGSIPSQPPIPLAQSFAYAVMRDGRCVIMPDVRHDPRWRNSEWAGLDHLGGYMGVPLMREGTLTGVLVAMDRPGRAFTEDEAELLQSLCAHSALAMEKADLLERTRRGAEEARARLEVSQVLTETLALDLVLDLIVEKFLVVTGADVCWVGHLTPEGHVQVTRGKGFDDAEHFPRSFARGEGLVGRCLDVGGPVWSRDILADTDVTYSPETLAQVKASAVRGALAVPIPTLEGPYGALFIGRRQPHDYPPNEVAFAESLAAHAGLAIQNARLFQQEQERRRQVEAVRGVTAEITRELDLTNVLGLINRRAVELVGASTGAVYLWDEAAELLVPEAWYGFGEWMREMRFRLAEGITGMVAQRREGLIVNDYRGWPHASPRVLQGTGITATLAEPLLHGERLLGVITVNDEGAGRTFTEQDRELLGLFAGQAAIAVENARLYKQTRKALEDLEALYESGRAIIESLDLNATLTRIAERARALAAADRVFIWLVDRRDRSLRAGIALGPGAETFLGTRLPPDSTVAASRAVREGRVIAVENLALSTDADRALSGRFGNAALLGIPLEVQQTSLGVLVCAYGEPRSFGAEDVQRLTALAQHAAIALEHARLYEEAERRRLEVEEALARVKQLQGLLPICSYCKKIRNDKNYWQQVESYVAERSDAQFSHGICPECYEKIARPDLARALRRRGEESSPR